MELKLVFFLKSNQKKFYKFYFIVLIPKKKRFKFQMSNFQNFQVQGPTFDSPFFTKEENANTSTRFKDAPSTALSSFQTNPEATKTQSKVEQAIEERVEIRNEPLPPGARREADGTIVKESGGVNRDQIFVLSLVAVAFIMFIAMWMYAITHRDSTLKKPQKRSRV